MLLNLIVIMIFDIEDNCIYKNWLREVKINFKCIIVINMYF